MKKPAVAPTFAADWLKKETADEKLLLESSEGAVEALIEYYRKSAPAEKVAHLVLLELIGHLACLEMLAKQGDEWAVRNLHCAAVEGVCRLHGIIAADRSLASKVRQAEQSWPLLTSDLKVNDDGYLTLPGDHLLRRIGVVRKGHTLDPDSPGTKAAIRLHGILDHYRRLPDDLDFEVAQRFRMLPPLTSESFPQWWDLATEWIEKWWGAEFQDHPDFEGWKAKNYERYERAAARTRKRLDTKEGIRQSFKSLAKYLSSDHPG